MICSSGDVLTLGLVMCSWLYALLVMCSRWMMCSLGMRMCSPEYVLSVLMQVKEEADPVQDEISCTQFAVFGESLWIS